eukprot:TRINITY_DN20820_c0_g1_i1.p1 TRINITY_DN20820_c0_g1~~TRINITY_DN20820_c0_g1_i1.p1  ORF type:complete len:1638 (-),score=301.70 TRINITY_DN20820_c0_g1_i1:11-4405(-)
MEALAGGRYEDACYHFEHIENSILEDEKRVAAAFKHFDKDRSGVLERKEFKFMCAYLGWGLEETNSLDGNQDGSVTLEELQMFVGRVGGVQRFFEQRRRRVSTSRKDICPLVGVEVGARVRSHFYQGGVRSSSWREAQVLAINVQGCPGAVDDRGVLLEFGFDEAKGTCSWNARQVVPPSWIISDQSESSLHAALAEVGIVGEKEALWSTLFPQSELRSIQALVSCQRAALAHIRKQANANHEKAMPDLLQKFERLGYSDFELQAVLGWVKDLAPLVIHVHLDKMGQFLESDEFYRNQFETKTSCGALDDGNDTRRGWERSLFGDAYEDAKPFDRCKYGALNVTNDYRGVTSANQYGDSYLVLKDARLRATFSATDSGGIAGARLGLCDRYGHVLNEYSDDELHEITRVAIAAMPNGEESPASSLGRDHWAKVLRGGSEDPVKEWLTVGYPRLARKESGRFYFELEMHGDVKAPQVGLLSEAFESKTGVVCTVGVGDDEHGWALDAEQVELWHGGLARCWEGESLDSSRPKQVLGVAVDLEKRSVWYSVNGAWHETPGFSAHDIPEGVALYPAASIQGRASFVFAPPFNHPPAEELGFGQWPETAIGRFHIDCPRIGNSEVLSIYKEFQIHGEVCLKKHVQRLVANCKYRQVPKPSRQRALKLSNAGPSDGQYSKVGAHNNAPLYHCEDKGWIFFDKVNARWCIRDEDTATDSIEYKIGDPVSARYEESESSWYPAKIAEIAEDGTYTVDWDDGDTAHRTGKRKNDLKMRKKNRLRGSDFKDDGCYRFYAKPDAQLGSSMPPSTGWTAAPESYGCVDAMFFRSAMKSLGVKDEACEQLVSALTGTTTVGEEVVMKKPCSDISFESEWAKIDYVTEDAEGAWKRVVQEACNGYLESRGIPKECMMIETEHPYPASAHSWTKDVHVASADGLRFVFTKDSVTYDSCATLVVRSGGLSPADMGPGARVEVSGNDGTRRFGTVAEVVPSSGHWVKLDPEKSDEQTKATEERCFVVKDVLTARVDYSDGKKGGHEIKGFRLDRSRVFAPVGMEGFSAAAGPAHDAGVLDWWRLDLSQTFFGPSNIALTALEGEGLGPMPSTEEELFANLEGAVLRLNKLLEAEQLTLFFFNGLSHRLVPEAHVTYKGTKVGDEMQAFTAQDGGEMVVSGFVQPGPAHLAGVRDGWELSLSKTLGDSNTGVKPDLTEELLMTEPEKLLELQDITLVFTCASPDPIERCRLCRNEFASFEIAENSATVHFETDGDGSSYPERRWGVTCLVLPKDLTPLQDSEQDSSNSWVFNDGDDPSEISIRAEPSMDAEKTGDTISRGESVSISEELVGEDGITYLKLADGRGWIFNKLQDGTVLCSKSDSHLWDAIMEKASKLKSRAQGLQSVPTLSREDWDEARLRALCAKHGWEFDWMSEDGERRRRGAERQALVTMPASLSIKADSSCPDGFQPDSPSGFAPLSP